jgi:hypothetical protein
MEKKTMTKVTFIIIEDGMISNHVGLLQYLVEWFKYMKGKRVEFLS